MAKETKKEATKPTEPKISYASVMISKSFTNIEKDLLATLLDEAEAYTLKQIQKLLADTKRKKVD